MLRWNRPSLLYVTLPQQHDQVSITGELFQSLSPLCADVVNLLSTKKQCINTHTHTHTHTHTSSCSTLLCSASVLRVLGSLADSCSCDPCSHLRREPESERNSASCCPQFCRALNQRGRERRRERARERDRERERERGRGRERLTFKTPVLSHINVMFVTLMLCS